MRAADLRRELRKHGLEKVEIFRSAPLKRISFRFPDDTVLKITYWANTGMTPALVVAGVIRNRDKAVVLTGSWVPGSATVHLV